MRHFYYIFFIVSVFAVMADPGCAQTRRIVFSPQWTPQSQFAGYYVAQAKGFYKEVGLDIVIDHPSASNPALNRLREGSSHYFATGSGHQIHRPRDFSREHPSNLAAKFPDDCAPAKRHTHAARFEW